MNIFNRISTALKPAAGIFTRNLRSDLKIKWVRPTKIPCIQPEKSGDCSPLPEYDSKRLLFNYDKCKELTEGSERLKHLFTLESNPRREKIKIFVDEMIKKVQRHEQDYRSAEARLAHMTAKIRSLQEVMERFPRNMRMKVNLKEKIDKRKRFLRQLRKQDYRKFEWILEKLDLVYKAYPESYFRIERRKSLRWLTQEHCENIKQQRLQEYQIQLEQKQLDFLENKIKNLEFIRSEQLACKVKVTVTDEEIAETKRRYRALLDKKNGENGGEKVARAV